MKFRIALFIALAISFYSFSQNKFITTKGKEVIGLNGKPFLMKGTNLGNWLVPEGYMFKFRNVNSPRLIDQVFKQDRVAFLALQKN